jgi:CHAT domain-containing protein
VSRLEKLLAQARHSGKQGELFTTLYDLGSAYAEAGQLLKAVASLEEAAQVAQALGAVGQVHALRSLGSLLWSAGAYGKAEVRFRQALEAAQLQGDDRSASFLLADLATPQMLRGDYDAALAALEAVLASRQEQDFAPSERRWLRLSLARALSGAGQHDAAAVAASAVVEELRKEVDPLSPMDGSRALMHIAEIRSRQQRHDEAYQALVDALRFVPGGWAHQYNVMGDEAMSSFHDAAVRVLVAAGKLPEATVLAKLAASRMASHQPKAELAGRDLSKSYAQRIRQSFRVLVDLLLEQRRALEAEQALLALQEVEARAAVQRPGQTQVPLMNLFTPSEALWATEWNGLLQAAQAAARLHREAAPHSNKPGADPSSGNPQLAWERLKAAPGQAVALLAQLSRASSGQCLGCPAAVAAPDSPKGPPGLKNDDASSLVLRYWVQPSQTQILVRDAAELRQIVVPMGQAELRRLVINYDRTLRNRLTDPRAQGKELFDRLVAPVFAATGRPDTRERLVIVADGALRYLPFAALYDGSQWLIERHALQPGVSQGVEAPRAAGERVLGLGVSEPHGRLSSLPAVPDELGKIVLEAGEPPGNGILPGVLRLNRAFTATALQRALRQRFPVVHVASHFVFEPNSMELSHLLLGDGSRLSMAELRGGEYPLEAVDLLVLSACETAVESQDSFGHEMDGFARLAVSKGVKTVIASLWPVADQSTALFMQRLHHERHARRLPATEALRRAQLSFIRSEQAPANGQRAMRGAQRVDRPRADDSIESDTAALRAPYAHPFYWAAFVVLHRD